MTAKTPITEQFAWLPKNACYEDLIFKRLVLGYVVIEWELDMSRKGEKKISRHITQSPILSADPGESYATDSELGGEGIDLAPTDKVIGLIPAPFPTYKVYGFDINGVSFDLGFEHPGLPIPNWVKMLQDEWEKQKITED